jgi:hypothetical protein
MIQITSNLLVLFQSSSYSPDAVARAYIKFDSQDRLQLCECNSQNQTLRQSIVDPAGFATEKVEKARSLRGSWPSEVQVAGPKFKLTRGSV